MVELHTASGNSTLTVPPFLCTDMLVNITLQAHGACGSFSSHVEKNLLAAAIVVAVAVFLVALIFVVVGFEIIVVVAFVIILVAIVCRIRRNTILEFIVFEC